MVVLLLYRLVGPTQISKFSADLLIRFGQRFEFLGYFVFLGTRQVH